MIGQTISHYKIVEKLGEGGMGVVYKAQDNKLKRDVAIKFLPRQIAASQEQRDRFKIEAQAAAALNHPNIATIYTIEDVGDETFIVMEYIDGQELREIVGRQNVEPLPINDAINYATQIAAGLQAAHQKGITHRDIKSSNIMVTESGQVKIMDFGLAKIADANVRLTKEHTTIGTAAYMSPEQARGEPVDQRSDIWSFGVVLYEMLTGALPFKGEYEQAVIYSICNEEPILITHARSDDLTELLEIVKKCLDKKPAGRYQNASKLLEDLTKATNDMSWFGSTESTRMAQAKVSFWWRRKMLFGILTGMTLVLLLTVFLPESKTLVKRWLGFAGIPAQKHLAVLPLTNVGGDDANQAFCDGVMETLTSKLTQMEQFQGALWVVPASEVRKGAIASANEAHRAFGVNLVVSGSLQKIDERFRLTLNLVDAKNLRQLSSAVIDNRMSNLAILQDQTVIKMAQMLELELHPQSRAALTLGETKVAEAYESYLQGRGHLQHFEKVENIDRAIGLFTQAIEYDSLYAMAFAGLGEAYWRKYETVKDVQWAEKAVLQCERVASLNDRISPVQVTLGVIYTGTGRYEQAIAAFNRALGIDPVNAESYRGLASAYEAQGNLEDAESNYKKAIELKPDYWAGYNSLGGFYYRYGRYDEAIQEFRQVIELIPQSARGYTNLCGIYFLLNRTMEAIEMGKRSLEIEPSYLGYSNLATLYYYDERYSDAARMYEKALEINDHDYTIWGNLASAYYNLPGGREKSDKAYRQAAELAEETRKMNPGDSGVLVDLAAYYGALEDSTKALSLLQQVEALKIDQPNRFFIISTTYENLGKRERALYWLAKAMDNGYSLVEIEQYPGLKELREDARYKQLLKHIKNKTQREDR